MIKLMLKRHWEDDYGFGGRLAAGWIIVERGDTSGDFYAHFWSKTLATVAMKALEKVL